jgi:HlyD family secretion protein
MRRMMSAHALRLGTPASTGRRSASASRAPLGLRRLAPVAALVAILGVTLPPVAYAAPQPGARPAMVITTTKPQTVKLADTLAANGSIAAWHEAVVGAEIGGLRLSEVLAEVGDSVRRGQVLARFSDETVKADLAAAQASLAEAQASLAESKASLSEAQANAERARQVDGSGALSAQQIAQYLVAAQTAQARVASLQARVQAGQAQVDLQQLRLKMTRVLAPDDGVICARSATLGSVAQPGQELFRLVRGNRLEWRAEVTASELARLKPKQAVRVMPASGGELAGTLRLIGPVVDSQTRNALVYVDLARDATVRAGMFARGEFLLGSSTAQVVPQQAVVVRDGFSYVFRLDADRVRQTKVQTGRRSRDQIEIVQGLAPSDTIAVKGAGFLNDGDLVQRADQPADQPAGQPAGGRQ